MADSLNTEMILKAANMIEGHLIDYFKEINRAYDKAEKELAINISLKFAPHRDGIQIATQINFVTDRVKDGIAVVIDPKQMQLFSNGKTVKMDENTTIRKIK